MGTTKVAKLSIFVAITRFPALESKSERLPSLPQSRTIFYYGTCAAHKRYSLINIHWKLLPNAEDSAN